MYGRARAVFSDEMTAEGVGCFFQPCFSNYITCSDLSLLSSNVSSFPMPLLKGRASLKPYGLASPLDIYLYIVLECVITRASK